jgi:iron complex outermembrane receptor protein
MPFNKKLLTVAVALSLPALVRAEDAQPLPEVTVQAPRTRAASAFAGSTVGTDSLLYNRAATSDSATLLKEVPGVSLYGAGGVSSLPVIHGMSDDRLRVKLDGMDLLAACPNHMNPPLSYIDPSQVGKIEVWAGVTPVSVGGDSIGGTIVVESAAPRFAAPGAGLLTAGEIGGFFRSNGNVKGGHLSALGANENFSVSYTGSTVESDNYDAGGKFKNFTATGRPGHSLDRDEVGSTAYKSENHLLGFALRGDGHLLEAKFGFQNVPYELYPNQRMDMLDNTEHRASLRYLGQFAWGEFEARAYHETVRHHMDFGDDKRFWYGANSMVPGSSTDGKPCSPISANCAAGMPMDTESENTGVSAKASINLSERDVLRLGGEYQHYRLDDWWPASGGGMWPGTFQNIHNGTRERNALFGEWESQLAANWMSLLGVRYEKVKTDADDVHGYNPNGGGNQGADAYAFKTQSHARTDNNWDVTALTRYTFDAARDLELGLARKVRSPNLYERYTWSTWAMAAVMNNFVGDGNGYVGNLKLDPEVAYTLSATFDWHAPDRSWGLRATPYYTRVNDYIDVVKVGTFTPNKFNVLRYENQSARIYGIDLSGYMPLGKTGIGDFGLKGLINYTNGENRDTHDDLYNIMPLNARLTLTHRYGGWDSAAEVVMVKAKDKVSDIRNEIETGGYSLVNLRTSYTWKQVRVDFGVDNLFDKFYYLPTGGAYTGQGRTMSINGIDWGIGVPGPGRSLYTGLNIAF